MTVVVVVTVTVAVVVTVVVVATVVVVSLEGCAVQQSTWGIDWEQAKNTPWWGGAVLSLGL